MRNLNGVLSLVKEVYYDDSYDNGMKNVARLFQGQQGVVVTTSVYPENPSRTGRVFMADEITVVEGTTASFQRAQRERWGRGEANPEPQTGPLSQFQPAEQVEIIRSIKVQPSDTGLYTLRIESDTEGNAIKLFIEDSN